MPVVDGRMSVARARAVRSRRDAAATPVPLAENRSGRAGFAGDEAFDQAESESLDSFNVEPGGPDLGQWPAQEVFSAHWDGDDLECSLHRARDPRGALDVVDEDEAPPRA